MSSMKTYDGSIVVDGVSYKTHKISSIRSLNENTKVYNLEVANDNSYTVNNCTVHNCDCPS
jgi:intein/homing endonuclease